MNLNEIKEMLSMQDSYTKSQLETIYGISKNTVRATLEACGLSTGKTTYSSDEIQDRFHLARVYFMQGLSASEIKARMGAGQREVETQRVNAQGFAHNQATAGGNEIQALAVQLLGANVQAAINQVYTPQNVALFMGLAVGKRLSDPAFQQELSAQMDGLVIEGNSEALFSQGLEFLGYLPSAEEFTNEPLALPSGASNEESNIEFSY